MESGQQRRHLDNRLSRDGAFQKDDSIISRDLHAPALPAMLTNRNGCHEGISLSTVSYTAVKSAGEEE